MAANVLERYHPPPDLHVAKQFGKMRVERGGDAPGVARAGGEDLPRVVDEDDQTLLLLLGQVPAQQMRAEPFVALAGLVVGQAGPGEVLVVHLDAGHVGRVAPEAGDQVFPDNLGHDLPPLHDFDAAGDDAQAQPRLQNLDANAMADVDVGSDGPGVGEDVPSLTLPCRPRRRGPLLILVRIRYSRQLAVVLDIEIIPGRWFHLGIVLIFVTVFFVVVALSLLLTTTTTTTTTVVVVIVIIPEIGLHPPLEHVDQPPEPLARVPAVLRPGLRHTPAGRHVRPLDLHVPRLDEAAVVDLVPTAHLADDGFDGDVEFRTGDVVADLE
mmetsp:Transcript_34632/g.101797  ORF Transcript_34632/g.101797 Transcript_34632/m.101797 type:complete len:325 (-) Transcript_34632:229-1203(-)